MKRGKEKGTALVLALIMVLVISVMSASLMFLAQSETWGSTNYRMMTQARYSAEAGVHAATNFLLNNYVPPAPTAGTPPPLPAGFYMITPTPAACGGIPCVTDVNGNAIVLSSLSGVSANYPNNAQQTAFNAATNSTLQAGNTTIRYTAAAQLLSLVQITSYGTTTPIMVETWKITAHGDVAGARSAEAEVSTILETQIRPVFGYAGFAASPTCGALSFTGNGTTNSYDSKSLALVGGVATPPASFFNFGGNLGTDGNLSGSGKNVTINGSLSTPDVGTGVCTAGNMTALSGMNLSQVTGGLIQLPAAVTFPTPTIPPPGVTNINTTQTLGPCVIAACSYGDISLAGNKVLTLQPGTYNINSISLSGNAQVKIAPDPITGLYGPVIINVTGNGQATPISLTGNGLSNPTLDPSLVQINYAGTGMVQIAGNGAAAMVVYAPNATADFVGNGAFYGSVIANTLTDVGNGDIHYDLSLKKKLFMAGNPTLDTFTWSKY